MDVYGTDVEIVSGACGWARDDGRADVHIHAEAVTEGGSKIVLAAGGVAVPGGVIELLLGLLVASADGAAAPGAHNLALSLGREGAGSTIADSSGLGSRPSSVDGLGARGPD